MTAQILMSKGNLNEAKGIYTDLVTQGLGCYEIYLNLGNIYKNLLDTRNGINNYLKAIKLNPDSLISLVNLGILYSQVGEYQSALKYYLLANKINPLDVSIISGVGDIYHLIGNNREAIKSYQKAILISPKDHKLLTNLGIFFQLEGEIGQAILHYKKALYFDNSFIPAWFNLAISLRDKGSILESLSCCDEGIKVARDNRNWLRKFSNLMRSQGALPNALKILLDIVKSTKNDAEIYFDIASIYQDMGKTNEAIDYYKKSLEIRDNFPQALCNLGLAIHENGDPDQALYYYNKAIQIKSSYVEVINNIGLAMKDKKNIHAALEYYNRALEISPDYPEAITNIGIAYLYQGNYKDGWSKYQKRYETDKDRVDLIAKPRGEVLQKLDIGKNHELLIICEQGLGDTIQFMRYLEDLKGKGLIISICGESKLFGLIRSLGVVTNFYRPEQISELHNYKWAPLFSVPSLIGVKALNEIKYTPYIPVDQDLKAKWKRNLDLESKPIIALNWQGNQNAEVFNLKGRSTNLEVFSELVADTSITLLSLQKGYGSDQLKDCMFKDRFVGCQEKINEIWDFEEIAAIISNCYIVVTTDTSIAHLAGAIGHKCWLLLNKVPDWRWGLLGESTFWYPSVRIFRQEDEGDWSRVIKNVYSEMQKELKKINQST